MVEVFHLWSPPTKLSLGYRSYPRNKQISRNIDDADDPEDLSIVGPTVARDE